MENPALKKLLAANGDEWVIAQVRVRQKGNGYQLCHENDYQKNGNGLKLVPVDQARTVAHLTAEGEFRPLKSAPNLADGWSIEPGNREELAEALNQIYPGALADWLEAQKPNPAVSHYRDYANRQTGMYRITGRLNDLQAGAVISVVCAKVNCLKRRIWTAGDHPVDAPGEKSVIPCLEPCAVFMEEARKAARAERERLELANKAAADLKNNL